MAAGDTYFAYASVANNAYLDLTPANGGGASTEAIIKGIFYNGAVEFYAYDGTNLIGPYDSDPAKGSREFIARRSMSTKYHRVKNVSGAAIYICADGVYTK